MPRRSERIPLALPATFAWTDPNGKRCQARGKLRDISPDGLFVYCVVLPPAGVAVDIGIQFTRQELKELQRAARERLEAARQDLADATKLETAKGEERVTELQKEVEFLQRLLDI